MLQAYQLVPWASICAISSFLRPHPLTGKPILFVGRMVEKKGADLLLAAAAILKGTGTNLQFVLIGDGPMLPELRDQAKQLNIDSQLSFLGAVIHPEIVRHYQSAKLAVFPFRRAKSGDQDGLGLVMIEAMGCGCPVVASDLDNTDGVIIDGKTGYVFKAEDAADLARAIDHALQDDWLRNNVAESARQHVLEHFDWQVVTQNYVRMYRRQLSGLVRPA